MYETVQDVIDHIEALNIFETPIIATSITFQIASINKPLTPGVSGRIILGTQDEYDKYDFVKVEIVPQDKPELLDKNLESIRNLTIEPEIQFLCEQNSGTDLFQLIKTHINDLSTFVERPLEYVTQQKFIQYVKGVSTLQLGFHNEYNEKLLSFLNNNDVSWKDRKKLLIGVMETKYPSMRSAADMIRDGIPADFINTMTSMPENWIRKGYPNPQALLINTEDQQIFENIIKNLLRKK